MSPPAGNHSDLRVIREALEEHDRKGHWPGSLAALARVAGLLERQEAETNACRQIALQGIRNVWKRTPQLTGETPETRLQFLIDSLLGSPSDEGEP